MNKTLIGLALLSSLSLFASNMDAETFKSKVQRNVLENRLNLSNYLNEVALEDIPLNEFRNRLEETVLRNRQELEDGRTLQDMDDSNDNFKTRLQENVLENRRALEEMQVLLEESNSELESFRDKVRLNMLENRQEFEKKWVY